jgi:UDP-glucuronate decarboxylase
MWNQIILITGGCGFIGSNLIRRLIQDKNNLVLCIDNLITGSETNIKQFINKDITNFKFIEWDICNPVDKLVEWIGDNQPTQIYHLASLASPIKYQLYPIQTLLTSINGTQRVLELCIKYKCSMLFTSTSEIYGDPLIHPQPEEYWGNVNTIGPRSCYDEGKRVCETLIYEYNKVYNLDCKIVRLFNTYGPKMALDDGRVITNFIGKILENKSVQIYGSGEQTRSFCFIDDMLEGLISMMRSRESGPINLGNDTCEFTLNELVKVFERVLEREVLVEYLEGTQDDPKVRKPVLTKARERLGFECQVSLDTGIKKTCEWFKLK